MKLCSLPERLEFLRKKGESISSFSNRLGLHPNSVANYRKGKIPDGRTLLKIHAATGVNLHWLLTGEGQPFPLSITTCQEHDRSGKPRLILPSDIKRNLDDWQLEELDQVIEDYLGDTDLIKLLVNFHHKTRETQ